MRQCPRLESKGVKLKVLLWFRIRRSWGGAAQPLQGCRAFYVYCWATGPRKIFIRGITVLEESRDVKP